MKINGVELRVLKMRLLKPFRTSFGVQQDRYPLLVRLDIDGRSQWGECVAREGPWYSYERGEGAWGVSMHWNRSVHRFADTTWRRPASKWPAPPRWRNRRASLSPRFWVESA